MGESGKNTEYKLNLVIMGGKVDDRICIDAEDDGVGFEPAKAGLNTGFGILIIREPLEQLDGHFEIESEPGRSSRFAMTARLKVEKSTEGVEV